MDYRTAHVRFWGQSGQTLWPAHTRRDLYLEQGFWRGALRGYTKSRVDAAKNGRGCNAVDDFPNCNSIAILRQRLHDRAIRKTDAHEQR